MKIGVLAGEASGDILGAAVLRSLRSRYPDLVVEGIGGPRMESQGLRSMFPMERLSVMGFVEPLKRLPELLQMRRAVFDHFRDNEIAERRRGRWQDLSFFEKRRV